jgi:hypothetical protein
MASKKNPTAEKADPSKPAQFTIGQFGGVSKFSQLTAIPISTCYDWWSAGLFPSKYKGKPLQATIMPIAFAEGIDITPTDLFVAREDQ